MAPAVLPDPLIFLVFHVTRVYPFDGKFHVLLHSEVVHLHVTKNDPEGKGFARGCKKRGTDPAGAPLLKGSVNRGTYMLHSNRSTV